MFDTKVAADTKMQDYVTLHVGEPIGQTNLRYILAAKPKNANEGWLHAIGDESTGGHVAYVSLERSSTGSKPLHVHAMYVAPEYRGIGLGKALWQGINGAHPGEAILAKPDPMKDKPHNKATLGKIYESYGLSKSPLHNNLFYVNTPKAKPLPAIKKADFAGDYAPGIPAHKSVKPWSQQIYSDDTGEYNVGDIHAHARRNGKLQSFKIKDLEDLNFQPSVNEHATDQPGSAQFVSRALKTDLSHPIHVVRYPDGDFIADGVHRLWHARSKGHAAIKGYLIDSKTLPAIKKADFAGDYAPGIPDRNFHAPLPSIKKPTPWKMSVQEHHADQAGHHYDLRLIDPDTGHAHSWALPAAYMPEPGKSVLAVPQPTHTSDYALNFGKGKAKEIEHGYGKGRVKIKAIEEIEVYHSQPEADGTRVRFNVYKSTGPEEYALVRTGNGQDRLVNKTYHKGRLGHLSLGNKPKTKEMELQAINFKNHDEVMMPKYDGAHTLLDLNAEGKIPRLFSYRTPKKHTAGVIEHTHKVPSLLEMRVPKELKGTVLRTETVGFTDKNKVVPAKDIAGMLNATVHNSRARQKELGVTLQPVVLDVERYKGKSVQHLPFKERYELAKNIGQQMNLRVTDAAYDTATKKKLLAQIEKGKHPHTTEGVVLRPLNAVGHPYKAKFRPDHDVHVREVFGATGKDGMPLDRAGGFKYSWTPKGPIVGSVGTGFDHALLKDMLNNPANYTGRVAKVQAEQKYDSGALGKASFVEWHLDKGRQL